MGLGRGDADVSFFDRRVLDHLDDWLRSSHGPSSAGCARTPGAPHAADPRSPHARLCHGERVARRRQRSGERRRKLHPRPHAQPRAGDDRAGRRAAGNGLQLHHGIGRQQDLSRHRARGQHLWHGGPHRPRQADRHHQPSRSLHPPGGGVCPQTIRSRHGRAVHRRGGRTRPGVVHGPGQSDRRSIGCR